jgi:hypothetical protein
MVHSSNRAFEREVMNEVPAMCEKQKMADPNRRNHIFWVFSDFLLLTVLYPSALPGCCVVTDSCTSSFWMTPAERSFRRGWRTLVSL